MKRNRHCCWCATPPAGSRYRSQRADTLISSSWRPVRSARWRIVAGWSTIPAPRPSSRPAERSKTSTSQPPSRRRGPRSGRRSTRRPRPPGSRHAADPPTQDLFSRCRGNRSGPVAAFDSPPRLPRLDPQDSDRLPAVSILGNRVLRTEDDRFLRGRGQYVENLPLENAAHVTFVRSLLAHAKINSIETSAAAALPGVHGARPRLREAPGHQATGADRDRVGRGSRRRPVRRSDDGHWRRDERGCSTGAGELNRARSSSGLMWVRDPRYATSSRRRPWASSHSRGRDETPSSAWRVRSGIASEVGRPRGCFPGWSRLMTGRNEELEASSERRGRTRWMTGKRPALFTVASASPAWARAG